MRRTGWLKAVKPIAIDKVLLTSDPLLPRRQIIAKAGQKDARSALLTGDPEATPAARYLELTGAH